MNKLSFAHRIRNYVKKHKIKSVLLLIILILVGYFAVRAATKAPSQTQYVLSKMKTGSVIQTVSGTGRSILPNQIDVQSQASGSYYFNRRECRR